MAPVGSVEVVDWFGGAPVGISLTVAFLVLGILLIALCMGRKKPTNAYDVNDTKGDGADANGGTNTKTGGESDLDYSWRSHDRMPPSTLERSRVQTQ